MTTLESSGHLLFKLVPRSANSIVKAGGEIAPACRFRASNSIRKCTPVSAPGARWRSAETRFGVQDRTQWAIRVTAVGWSNLVE